MITLPENVLDDIYVFKGLGYWFRSVSLLTREMIYCRKFFVRYYAKGHSLWDLSREHWYYWKYRYCNVDTLEAFVTALPVPNMKWLALEMSRRCKLPGGHTSWWWRHQMETFSALLALCVVTGEFPSQRPVTRSFAIFFHLPLNKRLSKQSWGWWFETPWRSLWRHCNVVRKFSNFHRIRTRPSTNGWIWKSRKIWRQRPISLHHRDVIMSATASQITGVSSVFSTVWSGTEENMKALRHWPLWGEFTGHQWISHTNVSIWWRHHELRKCWRQGPI